MSLRWRLALVLGAVVAVAVGVASWAAYVSAERELVEGIDDSLRSRAVDVGRPTRGGRPGPPPGSLPALDASIQVLDADGDVVESLGDAALPVDDVDRAVAAGDAPGTIRTVTVSGERFRMATSPTPSGAVQVGRDLDETEATLAGLRARLLVVGLVVTTAAAVLGWLLARGLTRPIERLTAATEDVAADGTLVEPIPVDRGDEVGRLAASFNAMLAALRTSREQQQRLVMDASHELRTPLTTLRTNIELLDRAPDLPADERDDLLRSATTELAELSALVTELVDLATQPDADADQEWEDVALDELVGDAAARARRRFRRDVAVDLVDPAIVRGRPARLERALANLLDNADKFSPPGTPISVTVHGGEITVADRGPGIPVDERTRVFDRFHRTVDARTRPGSGLGLSIVQQVATEHGGRVAAEEAPGGGALLRLTLPTPGRRVEG